jgi:integrase
MSLFLRFINLDPAEDGELSDVEILDSRKEQLIRKIRDGLNPDQLTKLSKMKIGERVQNFCDKYNNAGKARTAHLALNCLRSFFKSNGINELEIEDYQWRKNRKPEYVPTKDEVYRIADHCDARGRALILCAFQSGLRNATLRALCLKNLKEGLEERKVPIRIHVTPELKKIIPEACKENAEYFTFLGREAAEALREYLAWRAKKYGDLVDDDPLFAPYAAFSSGGETERHLSEDSPERLIKRAARRARIREWQNVRFHSLRKSFRTVLDAGYANGGQLAEDDKEFLMGHRLPSAKEPYHTANVDVLAERYMLLKWSREEKMTEENKIEAVKAFARTLGIQEIEVRVAKIMKENPNTSEYEAMGRILREQLGISKIDINHKTDPK